MRCSLVQFLTSFAAKRSSGTGELGLGGTERSSLSFSCVAFDTTRVVVDLFVPPSVRLEVWGRIILLEFARFLSGSDFFLSMSFWEMEKRAFIREVERLQSELDVHLASLLRQAGSDLKVGDTKMEGDFTNWIGQDPRLMRKR